MARDPSKPIAITIDGKGFYFTCSIAGATIDTQDGITSLSGKDFYVSADSVEGIDIVLRAAYKGAKPYTKSIHKSLEYKARNYSHPDGWIWEQMGSYEYGKLLAERKQARALRKQEHHTTEERGI